MKSSASAVDTREHPRSTQQRLRVVQAASHLPSLEHALETGRVLDHAADRYRVALPLAEVQALRAAGCLLQPEPGDRVLLLREAGQGYYILNVLEKAEARSTVNVPGELHLQAPSLVLCGHERVSLQGAEVDVRGVAGGVSFLRLDIAARDCEVRVRTLRSMVRTLVQRAGRCLRLVGEEQLKARRVTTHVAGRWSLHAEDTEMQAEKDVKVDGERILLG